MNPSRSVVTFRCASKAKIAALTYNWMIHFKLLQKYYMPSNNNCQNIPLR